MMSASLNIGKPFGLDIEIHWSFWLVVLWAGAEGLRWSNRWQGAAFAVVAILMFFCCVLLHELAHVWAAQRFGVTVDGIMLLPVGGLARIRQMPESAWQELAIAIAGPAMNFALGLVLLAFHLLVWGMGLIIGFTNYTETVIPGILQSVFGGGGAISLVAFLVLTNFLLAIFNLLPAFPMDGGRVLRAFLALILSYQTATRIAVRTGQALALAMIFFTLTPFFGVQSPSTVFISVFVLVGATLEDKQVQARRHLSGRRVADVMSMEEMMTVGPEARLGAITEQLLKSPQFDVPVITQGAVTGMLRRDDWLLALRQGQSQLTVSDIMRTDFPTVLASDSLHTVRRHMIATRFTTLPVLQNGALVGLINIRDVKG